MKPIAENRTLYEDWNARRRELVGSVSGDLDARAVQIEVLDYLLDRYRDSPEAVRPVCYPRQAGLYINDRALIVLRHLGSDWCRCITDRHEASAHVRSVIAKKASRRSIRTAPESLPGDGLSVDRAGETLRLRLSDANSSIRCKAAIELAWVGRLEDIGLLSDLLPTASSSNEHAVLIYAIRRLAKFDCEPPKFAPPEIVPIETPPAIEQPAPIESTFDPGPCLPDWICAQCGAAVSWYSEKCHGCGAPYSAA